MLLWNILDVIKDETIYLPHTIALELMFLLIESLPSSNPPRLPAFDILSNDTML